MVSEESCISVSATVSRILVGGCRASGGGLHLGHVYGCFHEVTVDSGVQYFFVISDCIDAPREQIDKNISSIFIDVLSAAQFPLYIVRESKLRRDLYRLEIEIERTMPFSRLRDAHPQRREIKRGTYSKTVSDLVFPVHQASFLLGLGCEVACFNDDNRDAVSFAREAGRRLLLKRNIPALALPRLMERIPGRLESWDGRRMAKINRNYLAISASPLDVEKFARRLTGGAVPIGASFEESMISEREQVYVRLMGADTSKMAGLTGHDRLRMFSKLLLSYMDATQDKRVLAAQAWDEASISASLQENEAIAGNRIARVLDRMGIGQ